MTVLLILYGIVSPHVMDSGIRQIFAFGIRNPLKFCPRNRNPGFGIRNSIKDGNSESKFHRHRSGIISWNPKGIPCMESRIQDCPGFPYMERFVFSYMTGAMQTSKLKSKQQKQRFAFHRPAVA